MPVRRIANITNKHTILLIVLNLLTTLLRWFCFYTKGFIMKRFLIVLLGSFCSLFCRMFPANALNPSECPTQVQQCTSQNKAPTPGPTGASGITCSSIQCKATGSSAVGTGYTVDGSNCTVCATNICNTGSGDKCQLRAGLENSWDKYLCSSYSCIKSGSGSSGSTICPKGQYLSGTTCVKCPNGSTTTGTGATMVGQCVCMQGYYTTGASGTGTGAVPTGTLICTPCPIGTYKPSVGMVLANVQDVQLTVF